MGTIVFFLRKPQVAVGSVVLLLFLGLALAAPIIAPEGPWDLAGGPFIPPFHPGHWLGTDALGRDVLSGIAYGARVSLLLGFVATALSLVVGVTVGAIAGYFGGWIDDVTMRVTEVFQVVPSFVFAMVIVAVFKPSIGSITAAISIISWPAVARLVRGQTLSIRRREFVQAAIVTGQPWSRIILRQVLPNTAGQIIVFSTIMMATSILLESALSFIGLGDPDSMSWGYMIGAGRNVIRQAWWISAFPGIALALVILSLNMVSEALGDALNPRLAAQRGR